MQWQPIRRRLLEVVVLYIKEYIRVVTGFPLYPPSMAPLAAAAISNDLVSTKCIARWPVQWSTALSPAICAEGTEWLPAFTEADHRYWPYANYNTSFCTGCLIYHQSFCKLDLQNRRRALRTRKYLTLGACRCRSIKVIDHVPRSWLPCLAFTSHQLLNFCKPRLESELSIRSTIDAREFVRRHNAPEVCNSCLSFIPSFVHDSHAGRHEDLGTDDIFERAQQLQHDKERLFKVRHLVFKRVGYRPSVALYVSENDPEGPKPGDDTLLATALGLLPSLHSLTIDESPFSLTPALAIRMAHLAPKLRKLVFRCRRVEPICLAVLLHHLHDLRELEVGSVKMCWCRDASGHRQSAKELGKALGTAIMRGHLQHLVLHTSSVFGYESGLVLREMTKVAEGRQEDERHVNALTIMDNEATSSSTATKAHSQDDLAAPRTAPQQQKSLKSLELHRLPATGVSFAAFLSSPAAAHLENLFIGGCKSIGPQHLAAVIRGDFGTAKPAFVTSTSPLSLRIDARLLSPALLQGLGHRIASMRLYEPREEHVKLLSDARACGTLSRCAHVVVLPHVDDLRLGQWTHSSLCPGDNLLKRLETAPGPAATSVPWRVQIGDEPWWRILKATANMEKGVYADDSGGDEILAEQAVNYDDRQIQQQQAIEPAAS